MRMPLLFLAAVVAGCASSGPDAGNAVDPAKVQAIKIDVTTYDELVRDFGPPLSQHFDPEGKLTATWFYVNTGAYDAIQDQQKLTVMFNKDRTVRAYDNTSGIKGGARPGR